MFKINILCAQEKRSMKIFKYSIKKKKIKKINIFFNNIYILNRCYFNDLDLCINYTNIRDGGAVIHIVCD